VIFRHDTIPRFTQALLDVDRFSARQILLEPGDSRTPVQRIDDIVVPCLEEIGARWEQGDASLSQVYMAGRICEELVDEILPPAAPDRKTRPAVAVAALNDYHLMGKRIVSATLRASGYEILDYGRMEPGPMADRAIRDQVKVLCVSTLMLHSALRVSDLRAALPTGSHGIRIVVGGAPFRFDDTLWKRVGADAMGYAASDAIAILESMIGGAA